MNRRTLIGGVLVFVVFVVFVAAGFGVFAGPVPGGDAAGGDDATSGESPPAETTADSGGEGEPFTFSVDTVEECGRTCRDVTATLYNERAEPAADVTAYIRIYAGESTTSVDDVVWEGTVDVGAVDANGSDTTTERIDLSFREALAVERRDGWITIQITVESAETTVTFQESRRVA